MKTHHAMVREVDFTRPLSALPRMGHNLAVTVREMPWAWRLLYVLGVALAGALVYYKTILVWGTVNPVFVGLYTRPYPPPYMVHQYSPDGAIGDPPPGWRPRSRVVVSMTTMPHHIHLLQPTLDSLLAQSISPDAIYLSIPEGRNPRSNMSYDDAIRQHGVVFPPGVTVYRCREDVGPLTKLLPALERELEMEKMRTQHHQNGGGGDDGEKKEKMGDTQGKTGESDPSTIIITVDDDQVYLPDTVKYLAWYTPCDFARIIYILIYYSFSISFSFFSFSLAHSNVHFISYFISFHFFSKENNKNKYLCNYYEEFWLLTQWHLLH